MRLAFILREDKSKTSFLQFKQNGIFYPALEIVKQAIYSMGFPFGVLLATVFSFHVTNKQEIDYFILSLIVFCCILFAGLIFFMFVAFARLYKRLLKIIYRYLNKFLFNLYNKFFIIIPNVNIYNFLF